MYLVREGSSIQIDAGNLSTIVTRTQEGVTVDILERCNTLAPHRPALASTHALFAEAASFEGERSYGNPAVVIIPVDADGKDLLAFLCTKGKSLPEAQTEAVQIVARVRERTARKPATWALKELRDDMAANGYVPLQVAHASTTWTGSPVDSLGIVQSREAK